MYERRYKYMCCIGYDKGPIQARRQRPIVVPCAAVREPYPINCTAGAATGAKARGESMELGRREVMICSICQKNYTATAGTT